MEVRLLGVVEVRNDHGVALEITAAKTRWLLVFLALEPGRTRSVESIIDALWPDDPPKSALNLVQGYVSDLRRLIGAEAIRTSAGGYELSLSAVDVDVERFRVLLREAEILAELQPRDALELANDCLERWTGIPFGESPPDGPLAAAATMLSGLRLDAEELLAHCQLQTGLHHELIPRLEQLVEAHPYRERLWAALAVGLYRGGRQAEALRRLHDARVVLEADLGISPGYELRDVEQRILNQDPTLLGLHAQPPHEMPLQLLLGRRNEVARLRDRIKQAATAAQHTVFIGGEPGIGKTTLSREVAREAAASDAVVLVGRCDEHVAVPYRPFIEAITDHLTGLGPSLAAELIAPRAATVRAMLPSLGDVLGLEGSHPDSQSELSLLKRFDTFCWLLRQIQRDRTLVVILDDIHWADSTTLRLLHYLTVGNRLPGSVTLATYRTTELAELLEDILADLRTSPLAERMTLYGLEVPDLRLLIGDENSSDDLADWVHDQTDGNPFLSTEIMRHISETGSRDGVPDSVTEVVNQRLRRLSAPARRLLQHAAILGGTAPVTLLRYLADETSDLSSALAELTQRGILTEDEPTPGHYSFTHAILRTAASSLITSIEREDLHLAAALAWSKLPASAESNLAVASHFLAAGPIAPADEAIDVYSLAGHNADGAGAKVEAVQWFDHALALMATDDERNRSIRLARFVAAQAAWHWHYGDHLNRDTDVS